MNKKYICKYCGKEFQTGAQLGGHVVLCTNNPKREHVINSMKKGRTHRKPKAHKLQCEFCGKEYEIICTDAALKKGKYRKTCSSICSHKLTSSKINRIATNTKISQTNKKHDRNIYRHGKCYKLRPLIEHQCQTCGKMFNRHIRPGYLYCSDECMIIGRRKKLSENAKKNKLGGLNINSYFKYKSGWYHGIHCDSAWEFAFILYCELHNLDVKRCKLKLPYKYNGKTYNYYPDFESGGKIYEIKGYWDDKAKVKHETYPDIIVLDKTAFKPYLDEVINYYGIDYIKLYDKLDKRSD